MRIIPRWTPSDTGCEHESRMKVSHDRVHLRTYRVCYQKASLVSVQITLATWLEQSALGCTECTLTWLTHDRVASLHPVRTHSVQTGPGVHPVSYPMGTGVISPGVNWLGHEANHSSPSSAEIKNARSYTSTDPYPCKVWCLAKHEGQLRVPKRFKADSVCY
jgi:hypothetical protein